MVAEFGFDWFGVADDGGYFRWFPDVPGQSENGAKMWPGHARMMDGCSLPVVEWREGSGDPLLFHAVTAAGSGAWFDAALVGRFVGRFDARIQGGLACPVVFVDGAGDPVACVAGVGGAAVRAAGGVVGS